MELRERLGARTFDRLDARDCGQMIVADDLFEGALDLSLRGPKQVAFRAAWALDFAFSYDTDRLYRYCTQVADSFIKSTHHGIMRLYGKMFVRLLSDPRVDFPSDQAERVMEAAFIRLIDPDMPPSVRVWCMEILCKLPHCASWVEEELLEVLDRLRQGPVPSLGNKADKLYRIMRNRQKS